MERAAKLGYPTATDLADALVYKSVPFRDAHETVARWATLSDLRTATVTVRVTRGTGPQRRGAASSMLT
jgi:argininosuccinate lyase